MLYNITICIIFINYNAIFKKIAFMLLYMIILYHQNTSVVTKKT
jgi:hypothetical protein